MIEVLSKITIRKVEINDIPKIIVLIDEFYQESLKDYGLSFSEDTLYETILNFVNNHIALLAEKDNEIIGCIGGVVMPSIFDKNQKIAQEAIWYMPKEERKGSSGIRLLHQFEQECLNRGAKFISMIHMSNLMSDELRKFYEKSNYRLLENHYLKEF